MLTDDFYYLKDAIYIFDNDNLYDLIHSKFGMKFIIHTKEKCHNTPHIHIKYQNYEVVLNLKNGEVLAGNIPNNKFKYAKKWVLDKKELLLKNWDILTKGMII